MSEISQKILESIKEQKIKPKPRWGFVLKNVFVWIMMGLSLAIGSLASAVIIHMLRTNDWDLSKRLSNDGFGFFVATLPYFWLIVFIIFIFAVFFHFKKTKKGYSHPIYAIVLVIFALSALLGQIFYSLGLGRAIDSGLARNVPVYGKMFCNHSLIWNQPERGIIVGVIQDWSPLQELLILNDLEKEDWRVFMDRIVNDPRIFVGNRIKVVGQDLGQNEFLAEEIRYTPCQCQMNACRCDYEIKLEQ